MNRETTLSAQIGNRLFVIMVSTWLVLAVLASVGLVTLYRTDRAYSTVLNRSGDLNNKAIDLSISMMKEMLSTRAFLISADQESLTQHNLAHQQTNNLLDQIQADLQSMPDVDISSLNRVSELHDQYDVVSSKIFELRQGGQVDAAREVFDGQSDPLVLEILSSLRLFEKELSAETVSSNQYNSQVSTISIFGLVLFLLLVLVGSGAVLINLINRPLRSMDRFEMAVNDAVQTGDFHPLDAPTGPPAAARLYSSYNQLLRRLENSSQASIQYMERLAHEMNSLLATILGYASLVADPAPKTDGKQLEEYGKIIVHQSDRMVRLVEDAMLGARIAGNQFNPVLSPTRVQGLLEAVVAEKRESSQREIRLEGSLDNSLVMADPFSLRHALSKVIDNAVRYSPAYSVVTVRARLEAENVIIQVLDCGSGIPAENMPLLFRPFGKIRSEENRQVIGSGMGLYLAREILHAQYGRIDLASQVGRGTTVTISMPLEKV